MATLPPLPAHLSPGLTRREAITDAITRFLVGLDTSNKSLFESSFTSTASLTINGNTIEGLDAIITECYDVIGKLDTTHFLTNVRIHVDEGGRTAGVTASALSQHYRAGEGLVGGKEALLVGSLYWVEVVRDEAEGDNDGEGEFWKIQHFTLKSTWAEGEWGVLKASD
ncbi:SnoaL-like domain-containing protein [Aspergillus germanicus]